MKADTNAPPILPISGRSIVFISCFALLSPIRLDTMINFLSIYLKELFMSKNDDGRV